MRGVPLSLVLILLVFSQTIPLIPTWSETSAGSNSVNVRFAESLSMPLPAIPLPTISQVSPISGVLRVLIVAVTFSDLGNTRSTAELKQDFFGTVGAYYKEVSYGAVTLQGDVAGWYRLNQSMLYYGRDCTYIDDADCSGTPTSWWLARDAVAIVNQDPTVQFSNYDYFVFIHAGVGEESSKNKDNIWSVAYLGGIWLRGKDKSINQFAILPESEASGAVPIGVYAHEFGHLIGLPDLYNTQTGKTIMGPWSLMDKGLWNGDPPGSSPSHMEAWSKMKLGWLNGSRLAVANEGALTNYTVEPTETNSAGVKAIKIPVSSTSPPAQYYLIEVRAAIGFDQGLPATGVLITYVDEKAFQKKITVIDGHPSVPGLGDATWDVGQIFTDERNNLAVAITGQAGNSYQVTVNRIGPIADLAVTEITTQPLEIKPNSTVTIIVGITNLGTAAASNVPVHILIDEQPYASQQVTLNAGATTQITFTWKAVEGTHTLRVLIDPYDVLNELNKANDEATYVLNVGPTLIITVPLNVTTGNATAWVRVNGIVYNATGQLRISVAPGPVTIEVEPYIYLTQNSRRAFATWADGSSLNPREITVTSDTSLTAVYKTQYLLTVQPNGGTTSPGGWFDENSQVAVTAANPSNVTEFASRLIFTSWTGDLVSDQASITLNMTAPITLQANWKPQYYLNVVSPVGTVTGAGWYDAGAVATVIVQSPVLEQNGTRQVFTGWNGTGSSQETTKTIVVNSPTILQATWKTQYYIQIQSTYGNPQGGGWQDAGTQVQISIEAEINHANRTRRVFTGWIGDYSTTTPSFRLSVDGPKFLTAVWTTQYQLSFSVKGLPNGTITQLNINNQTHDLSISKSYSAWFNRGAQINPVFNQTLINGFLQFELNGLYNSTNGKVMVPIVVQEPMDYTAVYQQTFPFLAIPGFPIESMIIGFAVGFASIALIRRRIRSG